MVTASVRKTGCLETSYYTRAEAAPLSDAAIRRESRKQNDVRLRLDLANVVNFGAGGGVENFEVIVLGGGWGGTDDQAGGQRNTVEAFAGTGPGAGSAQAIVHVIARAGVAVLGAVAG